MKNECIIVTGGMGYIGSHTIVALVERYPEAKIISIDNFLNSRPAVHERLQKLCNREIINLSIDLTNRKDLFEGLQDIEKINGIIHFAALKSVPDSVEDPSIYYRNNLNSLINILDLAEQHQAAFIFSSSCSVYGDAKSLPVTEEDAISPPACPYAATKQMGEQMVRDYVKKESFSAALLRYFNPIGAHPSGQIGEWPPKPSTGLLPALSKTLNGLQKEFVIHGDDYPTRDGSCLRDYIHVMDIAEAHVLALDYILSIEAGKSEVFNLGLGEGVSVREAVKAFEQAANKSLNVRIGPRRAGDVIAVYADNQKAKKILNWQPKYTLDDMMQSAWQWAMKDKD